MEKGGWKIRGPCVLKTNFWKLTVAELKTWLISKGIEWMGRKADLVERAEAYLGRN